MGLLAAALPRLKEGEHRDQVGTGALSAGEIASPLRGILKRQGNARVVLGEVSGFDLARRHVLLDDGGAIAYDALVVAAGASHAYFGHDEWASAAPGLKTVATIGRLAAVLDVRGVRLSGTLAWLAYLFVHLFYLVGLQNRVLVVIRWAVSFATHGRGARLITGAQGEPERRAAARPGSASRGSAGA